MLRNVIRSWSTAREEKSCTLLRIHEGQSKRQTRRRPCCKTEGEREKTLHRGSATFEAHSLVELSNSGCVNAHDDELFKLQPKTAARIRTSKCSAKSSRCLKAFDSQILRKTKKLLVVVVVCVFITCGIIDRKNYDYEPEMRDVFCIFVRRKSAIGREFLGRQKGSEEDERVGFKSTTKELFCLNFFNLILKMFVYVFKSELRGIMF